MPTKNVDYNRGLTKKIHLKTGVDVYMYKDEPGVFRNAYGTEVSNEFAKEAGFDVERLGKEKLKRERIAQVTAMVEAELTQEHKVREIAEEMNGFKVVHIGLDRYTVEDPDANVLTASPLPLETATKLLRQLNPGFVEAPKQLPPVIWTKKDAEEEKSEATDDVEPREKEVVQPVKPKVSKKKT